ncbi:hypothetical protein P9112_007818 [Eukaryota sp. TZLM1-RC]
MSVLEEPFTFPKYFLENYLEQRIAIPPVNKISLVIITRTSTDELREAEKWKTHWVEQEFRDPNLLNHIHIKVYEGFFKSLQKHVKAKTDKRDLTESEKARTVGVSGSNAEKMVSELKLPKDQCIEAFLVDVDGTCISHFSGAPNTTSLQKLSSLTEALKQERPLHFGESSRHTEPLYQTDRIPVLGVETKPPYSLTEMSGPKFSAEDLSKATTQKKPYCSSAAQKIETSQAMEKRSMLELSIDKTNQPVGMARSVEARESSVEFPEKEVLACGGIVHYLNEFEAGIGI